MKPVIYSRSDIVVGHTVRLKFLNNSKMKVSWGGQHCFDGETVSRTDTANPSTNLDDQVQWAADTFVEWLNKRAADDGVTTRPTQLIKRITVAYSNPDERLLVIDVQDQREGFVIVFDTICTGWQSAVDEAGNPVVYATKAEAEAEIKDDFEERRSNQIEAGQEPDEEPDDFVVPVSEYIQGYKTIWLQPALEDDAPKRWHEEDDSGVSNADRYLEELDYEGSM